MLQGISIRGFVVCRNGHTLCETACPSLALGYGCGLDEGSYQTEKVMPEETEKLKKMTDNELTHAILGVRT